MPDYSNAPELAYDWMIVAYFFLGGLSAGSFLFSAVVTHWRKDLRPLGRLPGIAAPAALAIGLLILLVDLGQPFRAWRLFTSLNPRSSLSWGVWFLNIFFALTVAHAWLVAKGRDAKARIVGMVGIVFAVLVGTYTGVLLTQAPGRPLWHTPLVPVLFLNGGLMSGTALALLLGIGKATREQLTCVARWLCGLVMIELVLIVIEVVVMLNGGGESAEVMEALLTGPFAAGFLGVEVVCGLIAPALLLLCSRARIAQAIASAMVLIGVLTMRYIVVIAGQTVAG